MPTDQVRVEFAGQDADAMLVPLPDGRIALTLRHGASQLTVGLTSMDAMHLGHVLRVAATHAAHELRVAAEKGGG